MSSQEGITSVYSSLNDLQLYKNKMYGDSAMNPVRVFSKLDALPGLCVRLDDKVSRIMNSEELRKNDVADCIGYLVLICLVKGWVNFDEFKD